MGYVRIKVHLVDGSKARTPVRFAVASPPAPLSCVAERRFPCQGWAAALRMRVGESPVHGRHCTVIEGKSYEERRHHKLKVFACFRIIMEKICTKLAYTGKYLLNLTE
jgi:hypothetical protein